MTRIRLRLALLLVVSSALTASDCGEPIDAEGVVVTTGSQQGLDLRHLATLQAIDFISELVNTDDMVAKFCKTGAGDQADIACADHGDLHVRAVIEALIEASVATGSAACVFGRPITR